MSALRSIRVIDLAASALHNEMCRGYARKPRKPRSKPVPGAQEKRRREYLEECGREGKTK